MNDETFFTMEEKKELVGNYVTSTGTDATNIIFNKAGGTGGPIVDSGSQSFRYDILEFGLGPFFQLEPTIEVQQKRLDCLLREAADCKRMLQQLLDEQNQKKIPRRKLGESLESK